MRRASCVIGVGWLALSTIGCQAFVPLEVNTPEQRKASFVAPPDHAVVIFYMEDNGRSSAALIDENTRCLAFLKGQDFFSAQFTPGRHDVILLGGANQSNTRGITIEVAAGKTYFLLAKPEVPPSPSASFTFVPIQPGTASSIGLDWKLQNSTSYGIDQSKCEAHLEYAFPGWGGLIGATKQAIVNAPPTLKPEHGIVWRGTAEKAQ